MFQAAAVQPTSNETIKYIFDIGNVMTYPMDVSGEDADQMVDAIVNGSKTAFASSLIERSLHNKPVPREGCLRILTDGDGNPRCLVRFHTITVLPFSEVSSEFSELFGEVDEMDDWHLNQTIHYMAESHELGYEFSDDILIVIEQFEVVEKFI